MGLRLRSRRPSFRSPHLGRQPLLSRRSMATTVSSRAAMVISTVSSARKCHQEGRPGRIGVVYRVRKARFMVSSTTMW